MLTSYIDSLRKVLLEDDWVRWLKDSYVNSVHLGLVKQYDSSGYYAAASPSARMVISILSRLKIEHTIKKINGFDDALFAACVAAAIAERYLKRGRYADAKRLCDIATSCNQVDLYPQRMFITADEKLNNKVGEFSAFLRDSFCSKPFEHFETNPDGNCYVCCPGWLNKPIGNLAQGDWQAIWRSDDANEIRKSILDGNFKYCSPRHCNLLAARKLEKRADVTEERLNRYRTKDPSLAVFSHDHSCNLKCPSCRTELITISKSKQDSLDRLRPQVLDPLLECCDETKITGSGDPFASVHFRQLIADYCARHSGPRKLTLHTNGVLFDKKAWDSLRLEHNVKNVIISIDAATEDTYLAIRVGGNFTKLMKNMAFIGQLRAEQRIDRLALICVVQKGNFREMPDFVRMAKRFNADCAEFWSMKNWGTFSLAQFTEHAIALPTHPEHTDFLRILRDPIMRDPIVSLNDLPSVTQ